MTRTVRLRPWQRAALDKLAAHPSPDFLAVATPGAGKTTFALAAAALALRADPYRRVVVCAPTAHLKLQWAQAAARFGLHLDPQWSSSSGRLPADMHGIITTYQQVATSAQALRALTANAFVVLDEIHHAADDRAWGDSVRIAFEPATNRLCLSGTPFRSDTSAIPFIRYRIDEAESDFEYGYGDALRDGRVVRPVYFPRINGYMEWVAPDGTLSAASFEDALDRTGSAQRLRTALSPQGEWIGPVLEQAHAQLLMLRQRQANAAGLVVATDQDHARSIADLMRSRLGITPTIATSDDPTASERIARFAASEQPWIIAVRMVSEGVDIPRLTIGVYATTTTTELFFRQAVGRLVRWTRGAGPQKAYLFIPDDPRLRTWAFQIADARRHSLRKRAEDGGDAPDGEFPDDPTALDAQVHPDDGAEQLSLFAALSATIADGPHPVSSVFDDHFDEIGDLADDEEEMVLDEHLLLPLADLIAPSADFALRSRAEIKEEIRMRNADAARELVRFTALTHAQVNAELNKRIGLRRITEATLQQLERRADAAETWLTDLRRITLKSGRH